MQHRNNEQILNDAYALFASGATTQNELITAVMAYARQRYRGNDELAGRLAHNVTRGLPVYTGSDARAPFNPARSSFSAWVNVQAASLKIDLHRATKTRDRKYLVAAGDIAEAGGYVPDLVDPQIDPQSAAILADYSSRLSVRAQAVHKRVLRGAQDGTAIERTAQAYGRGELKPAAKKRANGPKRPAVPFPVSVREIPQCPLEFYYPGADTRTVRGKTVEPRDAYTYLMRRPEYLGITKNERTVKCKPQTSTRPNSLQLVAN